MKKVLVVLLVAVMAITSAFAVVEGSVSAALSYDLDEGMFEYGTDNDLEIAFEFEEVLGADKSGALKPYVVVAAEATIDFDKNFANVTVDEFDVTKFQIVGNKWVLDFIPEFEATDLATDVIDGLYVIEEKKMKSYKYNPYSYDWSIATDTAMSFQYDGIGTLTIGADRYDVLEDPEGYTYEVVEMTLDDALAANLKSAITGVTYGAFEGRRLDKLAKVTYKGEELDLDPVKSYEQVQDSLADADALTFYMIKETAPDATARGADFAIAFESEDIALVDADKLVFKGAVGYSYGWNAITKKNQYDFGASAKASYMDYVTVAADMGFVNADFFDADIAAHIDYAPVTFDAYWATNAVVKSYNGKAAYAPKKDLVSLKAVADIAEINTKFTATASDIANKTDNRISVEAENTSIENFKFTLGLTDLAHKKGIGVKAGVEATLSEALKATANFKCGLQKGASAEFKAGVDYTGIENLTLSASGKVVTGKKTFVKSVELTGSALYEAALFDAELDVYYRTYATKTATTYADHWSATEPKFAKTIPAGLVLAFDLSSDKIVDGATLDFNWQSGQLSDKGGAKGTFGTLTASCTVEF